MFRQPIISILSKVFFEESGLSESEIFRNQRPSQAEVDSFCFCCVLGFFKLKFSYCNFGTPFKKALCWLVNNGKMKPLAGHELPPERPSPQVREQLRCRGSIKQLGSGDRRVSLSILRKLPASSHATFAGTARPCSRRKGPVGHSAELAEERS